ncbi:MAG TPA: type 4b pilus protein PilO2 [Buttiauxella sp.]|jgi:hypothetical protein
MKKNNKVRLKDKVDSHIALLPLKGRDIVVAGLIWQPIHTVRNIQAEAKNLIRNEKCQHFLTYSQGSRAQCGMTRRLPQGKRSYSAIMLLRESLGDSWLGLFRLPDNRFWLAAIDNGMVVPGGDSIFDDENLARERYRDYIELFAWQRKYVDGVEGIEGELIGLFLLLQDTELKNRHRILFAQEMQRWVRLIAVRGAILLAILGIAIGSWQYYKHQQEQERLEKLRAEKLARMKASGFEEGMWRRKPPALPLLNACLIGINKYPVEIAGWMIEDFGCDGKTVKLKYKAGRNATNKNFALAVKRQKFQFQKGMTAEITDEVTIIGDRKAEKLQPISEVVTNLLENLQLGFAKGKIDDIHSTRKKMAKFEFETQYSPMTAINISNLDGLVIHSIKGRVSSQGKLVWHISGEVYGK